MQRKQKQFMLSLIEILEATIMIHDSQLKC